MSAIGGPNVVEDGLVLALDAANDKSFRGEPTVNLATGVLNLMTGRTGYTVTRIPNQPFPEFNTNNAVRYIITGGNGSSTIPSARTIISNSVNNGRTFTLTVKVKNLGTNPVRISNNYSTTTSILQGEVREVQLTNTGNGSSHYMFNIRNTVANHELDILVGNLQVEEKPYATPFVDGTRGTTVATGGGWADRSGNNNHGELVNGPTFDNDNLGSLSFDGVDDSILIPNIVSSFTPSQNMTFSIWFNPTVLSNSIQVLFVFAESSRTIRLYRNAPWSTNQLAWLIYFTRNDSTTGAILPRITYPLNTWTNSLFTFNSSGLYSVYVNGILRNTTQAVNFNRWLLPVSNVTAGVSYEGNISQVKIYNRALSPQEVLQNYNATKSRYGL